MSRSSFVLRNGDGSYDVFNKYVDFYSSSFSFAFSNRNNLSSLVLVELPLPDPEEFFQDSFALAFPEVLAWSAAATGILLVVLVIKSFLK